jgi:hypothetical protein
VSQWGSAGPADQWLYLALAFVAIVCFFSSITLLHLFNFNGEINKKIEKCSFLNGL